LNTTKSRLVNTHCDKDLKKTNTERIFNNISKSKIELTNHTSSRLTDITMQKVKIPQEMDGFFLPQTSYENTILLFYENAK
jgi:hypothetical protein